MRRYTFAIFFVAMRLLQIDGKSIAVTTAGSSPPSVGHATDVSAHRLYHDSCSEMCAEKYDEDKHDDDIFRDDNTVRGKRFRLATFE